MSQSVFATSTPRGCALEIAGLVTRQRERLDEIAEPLQAILRGLINRPDLLTLGVPRQGNHVGFSRWLYYDGELSITLSDLPEGSAIPVHDHGTWEAVAVYRGAIDHTSYTRTDDGSTPIDATLEVRDQRTLKPGDLVLLVPPLDIHGFKALVDDTYHLAVVGGSYKANRSYFQPDQNSYLIRNEKSWRTGL